MAIRCCNGCVPPKRHTACWGHCPEYKEEKEKHDRRKAELAQKSDISGAIMEERRKKIDKALRGHRKI